MPAYILPNIRVTTSGISGDTFIKNLEKSFSGQVLYRDLEDIRDTILNETENFINKNRKRKGKERHTESWRTSRENNLINTLKTSSFIESTRSNRFRLGIGHIDFLNQHAKYWKLINYGGRIKMNGKEFVPGFFGAGKAPGTGTRETFHYTGRLKGTNPYNSGPNGFRMNPDGAIIAPMKYLNFMSRRFSELMNKLDTSYKRKLKAKVGTIEANNALEAKIGSSLRGKLGSSEDDFWR